MWLSKMRSSRARVIRRATVNDVPTIARIYVDCWRHTYDGILPRAYLRQLSYSNFETFWRRTLASRGWAFIAEVDSRVAGFTSGGRSTQLDLAGGEIYVLYVLPEFQRQGLGRALFDAAHYELARRNYRGVLARTLAMSPTRGFYERLGGRIAAERTIEIQRVPLREFCYVWPD